MFRFSWPQFLVTASLAAVVVFSGWPASAAAAPKDPAAAKGKKKPLAVETPPLAFPPALPNGREVVTDTSAEFLRPTTELKPGVAIAKTAPTVDFLYYPGQNYEGKPWSNWGDSTVANGKYYSAIGDHMAIGRKSGDGSHGTGTGLVFEYDPQTKRLRELVNTTDVLKLPAGHYTPGKVHSRVDMGSDGNLYFGTHRGSDERRE